MARVRNTWAICPQVGNNLAKVGVIPNVVTSGIRGCLKAGNRKDLSLEDGPASHQLVGEAKAHQGLTGSWSERMVSHTGTEKLPRLLREAAVEDHSQCAKA